MFFQITIQCSDMNLLGAMRPYVGKHGAFKLRKGGKVYSATVLESKLSTEDPQAGQIAALQDKIRSLEEAANAPKKRKKREPCQGQGIAQHYVPPLEEEVVEGDPVLEEEAENSQTTPVAFSLPRLKPV